MVAHVATANVQLSRLLGTESALSKPQEKIQQTLPVFGVLSSLHAYQTNHRSVERLP